MERVMIIGCSGSGKTTLAMKLGERTGLPIVHLDSLFWLPGWKHRTREDFDRLLREALAQPRWIMDGDYSRTRELRFAACDTVIWLDYPRRVCLWGVAQRFLRYRGQTRPDMGTGCPEKLDAEFLRYVWRFKGENDGRVRAMLQGDMGKRVVILRSRRETERFLRGVCRMTDGTGEKVN